jgi:hypothetical protein
LGITASQYLTSVGTLNKINVNNNEANYQLALTAGDSGIECDPVTNGEVPDLTANRRYDSRCLMAHHQRRDATACAPIVAVHIAAANAAGANLDQDFVSGGSGLGQIL